MPRSIRLLPVVAAAFLAACAGQRPATSPTPAFQPGPEGAKARARADSLRYPYTEGDIAFMTGMIHHHAQAIQMSKWAPSRGASAELLRLTGRIINAQTDEIRLMQSWLEDRNQAPPTVDSLGAVQMPGMAGMGDMPGMSHGAHGGHAMMMPGMLTPEQLDSLDRARGEQFDVLFLRYMIQHHRGAVTMVRELFSQHGSGQDETIFKFAADVEVDQSTEIRRMMQMLIARGVMPDVP